MMAWFAPMAVETRMVTQNGLYPNAPDRKRAPCNARFARCARKNILAVAAAALAFAGNIASHAQNASATQHNPLSRAPHRRPTT